jgi:hypothetical protein
MSHRQIKYEVRERRMGRAFEAAIPAEALTCTSLHMSGHFIHATMHAPMTTA